MGTAPSGTSRNGLVCPVSRRAALTRVAHAGAKPGKYDLLETVSGVPSGLTLEQIYLKANPEAAEEGLQAISTGLSRFLDQYTKG